MTQKELEEILDKHFKDQPGVVPIISPQTALKAMKEAYNKGVTDSAESAKTVMSNDHDEWEVVDKNSILKLLIP